MDLTTGKLNKIYTRYLLTALGSTIITSVYTSVDLICVGHACGPIGNAAISCVSPLWSIMIGLGLLFGIGGAVWMSNRRGAGEETEAKCFFTIALAASLITSAILALVYWRSRATLLQLFGADESLLPYAMDYTKWIVWAVPAFLTGTVLTGFIRNDGAPGLCTVAILTGGALNVFGDIYFVFGRNMGIAGAGLATAIGQCVSFCILCTYFFRKRCTLRLAPCKNILRKIGSICKVGFAPAVVDLTFGITVILFNRQIMRYAGTTELAVFGTVSNFAILFQSLFYGVGQAVQPIASVNFGAGNYDRVAQLRRMAMVTAVAMGVGFCLLSELIPETLLQIYMRVTDEVMAVGPVALRR
ncbi:MAG: MATE family efflux transporter, partial [Oscillospiraceae bacterium]|nr:MATE family efflux transporter [Oscillospiraceae bacterium]